MTVEVDKTKTKFLELNMMGLNSSIPISSTHLLWCKVDLTYLAFGFV